MKLKKRMIILLLALFLFTSACLAQNEKGDIATRQIDVVATTGMIGDAVENVGGERVDVKTLMGPGIDPHLYSASEGDVNSMANADVVFYNGLFLEAQLGSVIEQMGSRITTVAVAEVINESEILESEDYDDQPDPHVWFDVELWMEVVKKIRDTLIEMDPESADLYNTNAADYLSELTNLHAYVVEQAESIPEDQRVLITAHDAFRYFGEAYGFEVRGLQGISTESEAGTADVQELVNFIVERQINAIFIETSVPERNIEAVQAAVEARGHRVSIGGELFSDAMGSKDTSEGTYIGMVRHNIDTITSALLGE